ncbi:WD40 repeat [Streptomyces sp. 3213]|uniref:caspase family protein n=1 Tax=Streptomyces sp. 3213.3 TaxID=1855348 RepID=UPI0008978B06|nr:caspase family protein [Streptomyces sp. 3213.3]SED09346.1 WD40 repeat [Streptomyces sp. 3213] [Streptomyces sp. 3213.3]
MDALSTEAGAEPGSPDTSAPRRFLISTAVTEVAAHPEADRPELADDVQRVDHLFLDELGYCKGIDPGLNPTRQDLATALRAFATAPERRPDDYVVLYVAAHGVVDEDSGHHYLLLNNSNAHDLHGTALPTEELVAQLWKGSAIERLLVLIDACYAEEGADRALRTALEGRRFRQPVTDHGTTGLVLISSSRRKEEAYAGALSSAFDRAVRRQATVGHAPAHISLDQVMAAIRSDPEVPPAQRPVTLTYTSGGTPAFLPNPRHVPGAAERNLEEIDRIIALGARERTAREQDMRSFFLPRARGTDVPTEDVWTFTGRHAALGDITSWLAPERAGERLCVVTGDPGSGKSSVLGLVAVLSGRERGPSVPRAGLPVELPGPGDIDAAVNAAHMSTRGLLDALAAAAGCAVESLGALTAHLQSRTRPLVVLIDSLDEALNPHESVDELVAPLTDPELQLPLRLLVGARRHVAVRLPEAAERVDLDSERYGDPEAVRTYTRGLLCTPGSVLVTAPPTLVDAIAEAVAEAAGRSFLVARITARTIAREPRPPDPHDRRWRDELPRLPGEAMERDMVQRLGSAAGQARDLLLPLAFAQGKGLPWADMWPRLASALTGRTYGDDHIVWLRQAAGSYVVEDIEDDGSVYRVYHRALIEYLREGRAAETVQRTVTEVLKNVDHPYVRRYLALHAGEGGVLDPLLLDARFVLSAAPDQLFAALPRLRTVEGRRAGRAVRDMEERLRRRDGSGEDPEALAQLRLAAVCRRARQLADSCDTGDGHLPWRARWAVWNPTEGARRYAGMTVGVRSGVVAPYVYGGAEFFDLTPRAGVRRWDLEEGTWSEIHDSTGNPQWWTLTAPPQLPGSAAALEHAMDAEIEKGTGYDTHLLLQRVRVLNLWWGASRRWLLRPANPVDQVPKRGTRNPAERSELRSAEQVVLLAGPDGSPTTAALRFADGHVLVYRLGGDRIHPALTRNQRRELDSFDRNTWEAQADMLDAALLRVLTPSIENRVTVCAAPEGMRPLTLLLGRVDGKVVECEVLSTRDGAEVRTGHDGSVTHIDLVTGHPQGSLLVTAGDDRTVRLSSLDSGTPVRTLLTSAFPVASVAVRRVDRQWIVAVVTSDGQLHRVDLDSGRPIGLSQRVDRGTSVRVAVFDLGPTPCVSVQGDTRGLQLFDLVTGERIGGQEVNHSATALCTVATTLCVGGSDGVVRLWPTTHAADATVFTAHEGPVLALGEIRGPSGSPALVSIGGDYEIRCWDPARGRELWRRKYLEPGLVDLALVGCAATGRTADGRDCVVTGEYGGRVAVLLLRDGLPVAQQEFTVPGIVTALTTGQVRGRDVIVVGTGSGRLACWDVGAGRMYALGPEPDDGFWTTALALAPDGSGRVGTGGIEGRVREWSLPTCRPLGPARPVHRGRVCVLAYLGTRLVGSGADHRLVSYGEDRELRTSRPLSSAHPGEGGLLFGDERGEVWRVVPGAEGPRVTAVFDAVRMADAVAAVRLDGRTAVVVGGADGLQVRDGEQGTLLRRLRSVCDSGVYELRAVTRWRTSDGRTRPLLFSRSNTGVLEYWDLAAPGGPPAQGIPLVTPATQYRYNARLSVVPDGSGAEALLSVATWEANPWGASWSNWPWQKDKDVWLALHDVARGPFHDQPCRPLGEPGALGALRAVRCAGRLLAFVPVEGRAVRVLDTATRRWAELPEQALIDVFPVTVAGGAGLLLVGERLASTFTWADLGTRFVSDVERPARLRPAAGRGWRGRRARTPLAPARRHPVPLPTYLAKYAVLLPGGETYAVAGHTELAVVGVRDGRVHKELVLPSRCTALAAGPDGELIVGTRNGTILFD